MIYFFNIIGMAMLVASFLIMAVVHAINPIDRPYRFHLVAAGVLVFDFAYRYLVIRPKIEPGSSEWWFTTYRGGSLMLVPAWVCAIAGSVLLLFFPLD